jgi:hypothetical protein
MVVLEQKSSTTQSLPKEKAHFSQQDSLDANKYCVAILSESHEPGYMGLLVHSLNPEEGWNKFDSH